MGNALILEAVAKKRASFDDFLQNITAVIAEFKNPMWEIVLF